MMKRLPKYLAFALLSMLVLIIAGTAFFTATPPGRAQLANFVETQIGGSARIGRLGPGLPGRIVVEDVALTDDDGVWARIDKAIIGWRPIAFLRGETIITDLIVNGAEIDRAPLSNADAPDQKNVSPPDLIVENIKLSAITLGPALVGTPFIANLQAKGAIKQNAATLTVDSADIALLAQTPESRETRLLSLNGAVGYDLYNEIASIAANFIAEPALVVLLDKNARADGPLKGGVTLSGPPNDFKLALDAQTPAITVNEASAPPSTVTVRLSGLPTMPQGTISGDDNAGRGKFFVRFETDEAGDIVVPRLDYESQLFSLTGQGRASTDFSKLDASLNYRGEPGATPYPGLVIAGAADLSASLDDDKVRVAAAAPNLKVGDIIIDNAVIDANGPLDAVNAHISAKNITGVGGRALADLALSGRVNLQNDISVTLAKGAVLVDAVPIALQGPTTIAVAGGVAIKDFSASIGETGAVDLDASFSSTRWKADIDARNVEIPGNPVSVTLSANLDTDGRGDKPLGEGTFGVRSPYLPSDAPALSLAAVWDGATLALADTLPDTDDTKIDITLPLALKRAPALSISTEGPLKGDILYADRIETLAAFAPALESLEGDFRVAAALAGALDAPRIDGTAELENGAYTEFTTGFSLTAINLKATSVSTPDGSTMALTASAAGDQQREPSIFLIGEAALGEEEKIDARLELKEARFAAAPVTSLVASGDVRLAGDLSDMTASGAITINGLEAEAAPPPATGLTPIAVAGLNGESVEDPLQQDGPTNNAPTSGPRIALDITVKAPQAVYLRGHGLDSEWRADLALRGTLDAPLLLGDVGVRRGVIDFTGRRFSITEGAIRFDRLTPNNPSLNLRAAYDAADDVTAAIVIGGRARAPSVGLESTPALPREDIMALILFGKPANELTAFESLQIAQALASLGGIDPFGGGGSGLTGAARDALGVDMLNLDLDTATGASALTVGKYVADGLFVSATQNAGGDGGAVRVEYELGNSFTVETELEQSGDQTVSANWKRDF